MLRRIRSNNALVDPTQLNDCAFCDVRRVPCCNVVKLLYWNFCFCRGRKMLTFDQELSEVTPAHIAYKRRSILPLRKEHRLTNVGRRILAQLSPKELSVADLLLVEGTNRAIAGKLGISVETVKSHLVHMFHKVGVEDRLSLAMALIRHGVVACPCLGALERGQESSVGSCHPHLSLSRSTAFDDPRRSAKLPRAERTA
jgi:DNA-binding CsgD family transcriptional regulator